MTAQSECNRNTIATEGPQGMLKGAVTYGGLFFLISYLNTGGKRSNLLEYEEREVPATGNIK